jgi:hypothetical protein
MARLLDGTAGPGAIRITWNGEGRGAGLPSGVYFLRITTGRKSATRKMLLLR